MGQYPADNDWRIIEQMAGAQLAERLARGQVTSARDLATVQGIAGRNVRVAELIERREARSDVEQAPPPPEPLREQLDRLDSRRQRLVADTLRHELDRRAANADPEPSEIPEDDFIERVTAWVDELLSRSDAEIDAEQSELTAARRDQEAEHRARLDAAMAARRPAPPEDRLASAINVTPRETPDAGRLAPERPHPPRQPSMVTTEDQDHPSWRRLDL